MLRTASLLDLFADVPDIFVSKLSRAQWIFIFGASAVETLLIPGATASMNSFAHRQISSALMVVVCQMGGIHKLPFLWD
jgi:hypothetical protein